MHRTVKNATRNEVNSLQFDREKREIDQKSLKNKWSKKEWSKKEIA